MKDKIIEFIESYGHTLSAGDIQELEKFWEVPGVVVCDEGVRTLADTNALRRMDARSLDCIHRSEELTSATPEVEGTEIMSDKLIAITVCWTAPDASGNKQTKRHMRYLLKQGMDGNLRIRAAAKKVA